MSTPKISAQEYAAEVLGNNLSLSLVEWAAPMRELIRLMIENAYLSGFNKGITTATEIHRAATRTE